MGRKKKELTETQIEEQKQKWWGEARNERRRKRYQDDPKYRERQIQQVRESYRRRNSEKGEEVRNDDCRLNLDQLPEIGQLREVKLDTEHSIRMLTFTMDEAAKALTRHPQVVYRWMLAGLLPEPVYRGKNHRNRWQDVFTVPEMRAMIEVFGKHQETSQYYRAFHEETRTEMYERVAEARDKVAKGLKREQQRTGESASAAS